MGTRDKPWPQGTPNWVELATTDRRAAWDFYQHVFGWTIEDSGADYGHYGMAMQHGLPVAGLGVVPPGSRLPPAWTTYLAVDDVDEIAAAVSANGGTLMTELSDVGEQGRMAIAQDPTGGFFGLWQAGRHIGANVVNEPNTLTWNELHTDDPQRARAFYAAVFGWSYQPVGGGLDYTTVHGPDGDPLGGIGGLDAVLGPDVPPSWQTYFAVTDTDQATGQAQAIGGTALAGPFDSPFGRTAIIRDPQGASFAVVQLAQPAADEA